MMAQMKEGIQDIKNKLSTRDNQYGMTESEAQKGSYARVDQQIGGTTFIEERRVYEAAQPTTVSPVRRETPMQEIFNNEAYRVPEIHRSHEKTKIFDSEHHDHELHSNIHHVNPVERGIVYRQQEFSDIGGGQALRGAQHEANRYSGSVNAVGQYYDTKPRANIENQNPHSDVAGKIINFIGDKIGTHGPGEVVGAPPVETYHSTSLLDKVKTKLPFLHKEEQKESHHIGLSKTELIKAALPVLMSKFTNGQTQTDHFKITDVLKAVPAFNKKSETPRA